MKIDTVEVELKPKDIEGIKNKIKEDLINEGFVKIVRCKDCLFWDKGVTFQNYCTKHDLVSYPDDYCAWGEEQENE